MSENTPPRLSRRGFFVGAASVGAVAAGAVAVPFIRPEEPAAVAELKPAPTRGGGYVMSEHVKRYYKTTLV
jgi:secreted PhoX family phosphatase